jgi:hypothetical protein
MRTKKTTRGPNDANGGINALLRRCVRLVAAVVEVYTLGGHLRAR